MTKLEDAVGQIRRMNALYEELTAGKSAFQYVSEPSAGVTRVVFRDGVQKGLKAGVAHMTYLLARAQGRAARCAAASPDREVSPVCPGCDEQYGSVAELLAHRTAARAYVARQAERIASGELFAVLEPPHNERR